MADHTPDLVESTIATLIVVSATGVGHPGIPVELIYRVADPYAVVLSFRAPGSSAVRWCIARDLLIAGIEDHAGTGDVRIDTVALTAGDLTMITLHPPSGRVELSFSTDVLVGFLLDTEDLVPLGSETRAAQAELHRILTHIRSTDLPRAGQLCFHEVSRLGRCWP